MVRAGSAILFLALVAVAQSASAQIYRWTDETGRVIVSDTPPPKGKTEKIGKTAPQPEATKEAAEGQGAKPALAPEVEKKVRVKEKADKEAEEQRLKAIAEYCESAKERLAQLQSGERIGLRDKAGERYYMSDQQRAEEISKLTAGMQAQKCN